MKKDFLKFRICFIVSLIFVNFSCSKSDESEIELISDVYVHTILNQDSVAVHSIVCKAYSAYSILSASLITPSSTSLGMRPVSEVNTSFVYFPLSSSEYNTTPPESGEYTVNAIFENEAVLENRESIPESTLQPVKISEAAYVNDELATIIWEAVENAEVYIASIKKDGLVAAQSEMSSKTFAQISKPDQGWLNHLELNTGDQVELTVRAIKFSNSSQTNIDEDSENTVLIVWGENVSL